MGLKGYYIVHVHVFSTLKTLCAILFWPLRALIHYISVWRLECNITCLQGKQLHVHCSCTLEKLNVFIQAAELEILYTCVQLEIGCENCLEQLVRIVFTPNGYFYFTYR